jgi:hypothetical protein
MFLQMIIELAPLERALSYFMLVLVRCHRVLRNRVSMSVFHRFRRFQVGLFVVLDLCVSVGCGPGRG